MRGNMNPRKKTVLTAAAAFLIAVLVLSGCTSLNPFKPSALSLTKDALTNIDKVDSGKAEYTMDSDFSIGSSGMDLSMDMQLKIDGYSEFTKDPERTKNAATFKINLLGQEEAVNTEGYTDKLEDGSTVTYSKAENGEWKKMTTPPEEGESDSGIDPLTLGGGLLKLAVENPLDAKLLEETATVHDKEAYQINCTVPGSLLKEVVDNIDDDRVEKIEDVIKEIDWDSVSIPAEFYIYKENKLPARIYLDCQTIGTQFIGALMNQMGEDKVIEGFSVEAKTLTIDIIIDEYNEIAPIEIPQEALDAEEVSAEEGLSNLPNMF